MILCQDMKIYLMKNLILVCLYFGGFFVFFVINLRLFLNQGYCHSSKKSKILGDNFLYQFHIYIDVLKLNHSQIVLISRKKRSFE
jgi:hypothetical protein